MGAEFYLWFTTNKRSAEEFAFQYPKTYYDDLEKIDKKYDDIINNEFTKRISKINDVDIDELVNFLNDNDNDMVKASDYLKYNIKDLFKNNKGEILDILWENLPEKFMKSDKYNDLKNLKIMKIILDYKWKKEFNDKREQERNTLI